MAQLTAPREQFFDAMPQQFDAVDLERVESLKPALVYRVRGTERRGVLVITGMTRYSNELPAWLADGCLLCKMAGEYERVLHHEEFGFTVHLKTL